MFIFTAIKRRVIKLKVIKIRLVKKNVIHITALPQLAPLVFTTMFYI